MANKPGQAVQGVVENGRIVFRPIFDEATGDPISVADRRAAQPRGSKTLAPGWTTTPPAPKPARDFRTEARLLFPWLPEPLLGVFVEAWETYGDAALALQTVRSDSRYDQFFPGNRRENGLVRMSEGEYLATIEGFDRGLRMFQLDPADHRQRYVELIEHGKSPDEFVADLAEVQQEVLLQAPAVRQFYAASGYSADVSDRAIFASRLSEGVSPQVFEQRFRAAQIGAEATSRGFTYGRGQAERLAQLGVGQADARQIFSQAAGQLPTLNELLDRHNDPEDDLTLDEFTDAIVLRDPDHLQAIARVLTSERSLFSSQDVLARDDEGRVRGLRQR